MFILRIPQYSEKVVQKKEKIAIPKRHALQTNVKIDVSSTKSLTFDIKLIGILIMYIKNCHGPKIDPCGMPIFIISQRELRSSRTHCCLLNFEENSFSIFALDETEKMLPSIAAFSAFSFSRCELIISSI